SSDLSLTRSSAISSLLTHNPSSCSSVTLRVLVVVFPQLTLFAPFPHQGEPDMVHPKYYYRRFGDRPIHSMSSDLPPVPTESCIQDSTGSTVLSCTRHPPSVGSICTGLDSCNPSNPPNGSSG